MHYRVRWSRPYQTAMFYVTSLMVVWLRLRHWLSPSLERAAALGRMQGKRCAHGAWLGK